MIPFSKEAASAFDALVDHYERLGRDRAIDRLIACVEQACMRKERQQGLFYQAPRPYPSLATLNWEWTKEGSYWIAFADTDRGLIVAGIFHEAGDIVSRARE